MVPDYIAILHLAQVGDVFKALEDNTGIQRLYLAYGLIGLTVTWLAFGFGGQLVANTIGLVKTFYFTLELHLSFRFAYPAYCSIQALESKQKGDDTQWLTYWVVFAAFSVLEYFADFIAGWVGIYLLMKTFFVLSSKHFFRFLSTG